MLYALVFVWKPISIRPGLSRDYNPNNDILTDGKPVNGSSRWVKEFSHSVIPRNCHSHNDYWRPYPLFSALAAGCIGVEADIWLSDDGTDLLVGHDRESLSSQRTLKTMYLDPLLEIIEQQNPEHSWGNSTPFDRARGIFNTQLETSVVLLIDVKSDAIETWPLLVKQLEPLRQKQFLTRYDHPEVSPGFITKQEIWPGPVTVVGTGNLDRHTFFDWHHRSYPDYMGYHDTFIDAPLSTLLQDNTFRRDPSFGPPPPETTRTWTESSQLWSSDDAYYASTSFKEAIGSVRFGFSQKQLATVRAHVNVATLSGLKARYWDIPDWPIGYRDYIWRVLTNEGIHVLNVDDLESAARMQWTDGYLVDLVWMSLVSVYLVGCGIGICFLFRARLRKQQEQALDIHNNQVDGQLGT